MVHEIKRFFSRKDKVETFRKFLEKADVLKTDVFVLKQIKKGIMIGKVREAMVKVFYALGTDHPLANEFRSKLARLLY